MTYDSAFRTTTQAATARNSSALRVACLLLVALVAATLAGAGARADHTPTLRDDHGALETRSLLFSRITEHEGLSQATVHAITQDQQGYIWLGTQEGLNRYDGKDLTTYENQFDNARSLSDSWIWALTVSADGTLWIGTEGGGLNRYNPDSDDFTHFRHDRDNPASIGSDNVRVVYEDSRGTLWIGTDGGGLNRFDEATGEFYQFRHDPEDYTSLTSDRVLAVAEDSNGRLWVGTMGGGLSLLDQATGLFTHFRHSPDIPGSLSDDQVRSIYEDREGRIWVGTYNGGLNLFEPATGLFQHFRHEPGNPASLSHNRVRSIYQDRAGSLWVGTDSGLNEWRAKEEGFVHYDNNPVDTSSLSDNRVTQLFQDRGGVLWVGTYKGVNSWNYLSDAYTYYQAASGRIRLSSDIITTVDADRNGELWIGTYGGGLNRVNPQTATVTYYRSAESGVTPGEARLVLADDRVMAVHVDFNQQVWIGTRSGGLSKLDPYSGEISHFRHDPTDDSSISSDNVSTILSDRSGEVWVGTYGGGLNHFNAQTGRFTTYRHQPGNAQSISSDQVLALHRDRAGVLWVGTQNSGFNRFDEGSGTFQQFRHDPNDREGLSRDSAWIIHEGYDGSLWIGTNGGGLNRWRPENRSEGKPVFEKYHKGTGLLSDTVQSLVEDSAGMLWISSNRGLVRLDPSADHIRHLGRGSGLKSVEFNHGAGVRSINGRLLMGSVEGLVAFYPSQISTNRHLPEIVLAAHGRMGPFDDRYRSKTDKDVLELDFSEDVITFEFSGLDYTAPELNRYRYKLEGFDQDWSEAVEFQRATYTNLAPGNYTFRVQAANNDGIWNEEGASMQLRVIPPLWLTPGAFASYALLAFAMVFGYHRFKAIELARATAHQQELELQVKLRTEELASRNQTLESLNDQLKQSARTDSLTGLKNRRFLDEFIEIEVAHALRANRDLEEQEESAGSPDIAPALSFMMLDLDGFKKINDNFGHHAGDQALLQVRDLLCKCCRQTDTIVRWGGDEFLIVSRNTSSRAAEKLAERVRSSLAEHKFMLAGGLVARLSCSIGFSVYPFNPLNPHLASWEQVSAIADQCTYIAKQNGKNCWVGVHGKADTTAEDVELMRSNIHAAMETDRIGVRSSVTEGLNLTNLQRKEGR